MCMKKVNLLLVSDSSAAPSSITDSLSDCSLFEWKIETTASVVSALRKVGREHFDACLVDNSLSEPEANHFLAKMAADHQNLAVVIVDSAEGGLSGPAFDGLVDGRLSLINQGATSDPSLRQSVESRLFAALLSRKDREMKSKAATIDELNSALNVIVQRVGKDVFEIEDRLQMNLKLLVFPYIEQLKSTRLQKGQQWLLDVLESNIRKIFSPFLKNLLGQSPQLSYAETRVADLIKEGKSSKEIANILGVSEKTILTHRFHIRTKLGIKNKDVSLMSYLMSIE